MADSMASAPFMGGGNPSGGNNPGIPGGGAIGSTPNPLIPQFPTGATGLPLTNPIMRFQQGPDPRGGPGGGSTVVGNSSGYDPAPSTAGDPGGSGISGGSFPANTVAPSGSGGSSGITGTNLAASLGFDGVSEGSFLNAMSAAGYGSGVGQLLWNFLQSGAGFNPQALQALFASLQPQISRGTAQIQEQFGAEGLGSSSPAAIGMGDFLSQVNLNEGQIAAQMYEQSVQDYMSVLTGGKATPLPSGLGALIGGAGSLAGGLASLYKVLFPSSGSSGGNSGGGSPIPDIGNDPNSPFGLPPFNPSPGSDPSLPFLPSF
jgi:hypothetical protein